MVGDILTMLASPTQIRLLLTNGPDELMRAVFPPCPRTQGVSSAPLLLQAIASWLGNRVHVVLCADYPPNWSCLGLSDDLGCGLDSLFYTVEVVERGALRRRGRRLRGIGDFRQLHLLRRSAAETGAS